MDDRCVGKGKVRGKRSDKKTLNIAEKRGDGTVK